MNSQYLHATLVLAGLGLCAGCSSRSLFTDATRTAGLHSFIHHSGAHGDFWMPEVLGAGAAFLDWDGDGWQDVMLVSGGTWTGHQPPALRLFRNNHDGEFTEVTQESGLANIAAYGFGIAAADYDNDGDQDVYLTALETNMLLRNDGGEFTDVGAAAGVSGPPEWSSAALFFDADRDGWLDLYVAGYVPWDSTRDVQCTGPDDRKIYCTPHVYGGVPNRFYHNNGDGTFADWTGEVGLLPSPGKTLGAVALDYNSDLWPDLAVANDLEADQLFVNNGDGTFTERGLVSGIAYDARGIATAGMGIGVGDFEGEGEVTLVIGNFSNQMMGVFRHERNGRFLDRAASSRIGGMSRQTLTFGLLVFDADLDGDLDVFAANGHIHHHMDQSVSGITYRQSPHLFLNRGDGVFEDHGGEFPRMLGRGAAYGDVDGDGDLDVLTTQNGDALNLWRNEMGGHFLRVLLLGTVSNRDGAGARLELFSGELRQVRYAYTGGSYLSQSEQTITFGLGRHTVADSLLVAWPSGRFSRSYSLPADTLLVVTE